MASHKVFVVLGLREPKSDPEYREEYLSEKEAIESINRKPRHFMHPEDSFQYRINWYWKNGIKENLGLEAIGCMLAEPIAVLAIGERKCMWD